MPIIPIETEEDMKQKKTDKQAKNSFDNEEKNVSEAMNAEGEKSNEEAESNATGECSEETLAKKVLDDEEAENHEQAADALDDEASEEEGAPVEAPEDSQEEEKKEPEIDWKDRCLRTMAELENVQKTVPKRIEEGISRFKKAHFANLLELADAFERALALKDGTVEQWQAGVESLARMHEDILSRAGLKRIDETAKKFDPNLHEAISAIPMPGKEDEEIVEVVRSGWLLNGKLLRPMGVVVARNNAE